MERGLQPGARFGSSPYIEADLFSTEKQLILRRKSGKQVWSHLNPKNTRPLSCAWSPDGKVLAVVYDDKTCELLHVATGKAIESSVITNASCLAWPSRIQSTLSRKHEEGDLLNNYTHSDISEARSNSEMIIGDYSGTLKVVIFGTFSIGPISLGAGAHETVTHVAIDSNSSTYVALLEQKRLVILNADFSNSNLQKLALAKARVDVVIDQLCVLVKRYNTLVEETHSIWKQFSVPSPGALCETLLTGYALDSEVADWMKSQHEAGFKRWYKSVSSAIDTLRSLLVDKITPVIQQILAAIGEICGLSVAFNKSKGDLDKSASLATLVLEQIFEDERNLAKSAEVFENFAAWLETAFNEEIDRLGGVTKRSQVDISDILQNMCHLLALQNFGSQAKQLQIQFDSATSYICRQLSDCIEITETLVLPEHAAPVLELSAENNMYKVVYEDAVVRINDGGVVQKEPLT